MCLILIHYEPNSERPLVVAANRDEFYARPALTAHFWDDQPDVFAGRDCEEGGTWLGIDRRGRFAAVTNFSQGDPLPQTSMRSRGELVSGFLASSSDTARFMDDAEPDAYRGFNLLLWDGQTLGYLSNRAESRLLNAGTYGLTNAELGARWPKATKGVTALSAALNDAERPLIEALLAILADTSVAPDRELPNRGNPIELERRTAARFIVGEEYGTRASTSVVVTTERIDFVEQTFTAGGIADRYTRQRITRVAAG